MPCEHIPTLEYGFGRSPGFVTQVTDMTAVLCANLPVRRKQFDRSITSSSCHELIHLSILCFSACFIQARIDGRRGAIL